MDPTLQFPLPWHGPLISADADAPRGDEGDGAFLELVLMLMLMMLVLVLRLELGTHAYCRCQTMAIDANILDALQPAHGTLQPHLHLQIVTLQWHVGIWQTDCLRLKTRLLWLLHSRH